MSLSYFYISDYDQSQKAIALDEDTSYHVAQVLRMKAGDNLQLTDGKGSLLTARIAECHKKNCTVQVEEIRYVEQPERKVSIAISLNKDISRFEWFLEKATEIGVNEIIPIISERTIKQKIRYERMKGISISAMLQSQQCWLPELHEPIVYELFFRQEEIVRIPQKFIAHCEDGTRNQLSAQSIDRSCIILIGPAGDFSPAEIEMANSHHFIPVALGETRLRTETAGIVAATLLVLK